jgi:four helix bundle protein
MNLAYLAARGALMASSFRDLRVWQEAMQLTIAVYKSTANFPRHEVYGLSQQLRRAVVSVPSNIAEGKGQNTDPAFCKFLFHARCSLLEVQTQLMIAQELEYLAKDESSRLLGFAAGVGRSLSGLINSLRQPAA